MSQNMSFATMAYNKARFGRMSEITPQKRDMSSFPAFFPKARKEPKGSNYMYAYIIRYIFFFILIFNK